MSKRLALVTGGTTGIGAAICIALKAEGYDVAANFITDEEQANAFAKEAGVSVYQWDVSDFDQCEAGVKKICADFGIRTPLFSVGTQRDHIAPWKSVYKILLLTASEVTFVLTSGGHNAGIVSEPGHKGRTFQMATSQYCKLHAAGTMARNNTC